MLALPTCTGQAAARPATGTQVEAVGSGRTVGSGRGLLLAFRSAVVRVPAVRPISIGVSVSGDLNTAELDSYSRLAGHTPAVAMWYQSWSEPVFYSRQISAVRQRGITPMITWMPQMGSHGVPLRQIAQGKWDKYLVTSAKLVRSAATPILLRFAHEMNLTTAPYGRRAGNTAADFVAAWRHVVTVFRQQRVSNVQWVWSPNVDCHGACPFSAFFPGDSYVDWVGLDGYNYAAVSRQPWVSLTEVFSNSYATMIRLTSKPVIIAETGSTELGGDKAAWVQRGFLTDIPRLFPRVRAVVWFDRLKETDWRVNSSAKSLVAWRAVVDSRLYSSRRLRA